MARVRVVLFDLDGTLIDSAPDLAAAANVQRERHGLPPLPFEALRPHVGSGARGMVGSAFGVAPGMPAYDEMRAEFLQIYERCMLDATVVFDGMRAVLAGIEAAELRWGIVTNKSLRLAAPIVEALGLCSAVLIGGDSTAHTKPHPAPLLEAARCLQVAAADCVYLGDDVRDMRAGRAAGMATLAAAWGYLGVGEPLHDWGADAVIEHPAALLNWLELT
jgi:phosphoglycolate phosphatase